ncbi:MAG TPA: hypothetical protein VN957_13510 [Chthoniobacterales bacterium]|jgi:hypothetical protein|nr:hypothetical protein [Chthoniobacterales bacterium]
MSGAPPIKGQVDSIARGIGDTQNPTGANLLQNVNASVCFGEKPSGQWIKSLASLSCLIGCSVVSPACAVVAMG